MALIECPDCHSQISDAAPACPKCGRPNGALPLKPAGTPSPTKFVEPPKKRLAMAPVLITLVLAVLAVLFYSRDGSSPSSRSDTTSSSVPASQRAGSHEDGARGAEPPNGLAPPAPEIIDISAPQLFGEYQANEVLADTKYKDKWIYVHGVVVRISKDFSDDPYVELLGTDEYQTVHANFSKAAISQLATLRKGEQVSIMCRGKGMVISSPILDCSRSDAPAPPTAPAPPATPAPPVATGTASTTTEGAVGQTFPASFDCTKAKSDAEHLICSDAELAAEDVQLAAIYAQAKAAASDQSAFKDRTRARWNYREKICHDRECLVQWYADQKAELSQIVQTGQVTQDDQTSRSSAALSRMTNASGAYMFDLCKSDPLFKTKFEAILSSKQRPEWISACGDGVQSPSKSISVGGERFVMFSACKPHECTSQQIIVLYNGKDLYGVLVNSDEQGNAHPEWITPVDPKIEPFVSQLVSG
ncbi:Ivy family c-type lysozyme inhibitor [Dyella terrae]|uniref:Ivy family c-type lysozyme inhibitor n=1 Tax=Dyella terrae TaxID=522259 RepID=UPI001EFD90D8|nr:Ivy family c-type lysozyme inhibitor [Dyella terrae]ULU25301.1 Inhibitor of lysozyme protein [Dyella terrae]